MPLEIIHPTPKSYRWFLLVYVRGHIDTKDRTCVLFKVIMWQRNYEYVITQACNVLSHAMFQQGLFKFQTMVRTNKNKKYSLKQVNSLAICGHLFLLLLSFKKRGYQQDRWHLSLIRKLDLDKESWILGQVLSLVMGLRVNQFFYLGLHFLISQIKEFGWISNFPTSFSFGHVILIKIHRNPGCKRHKQVASQNKAGLELWYFVCILSPFFWLPEWVLVQKTIGK